MDTEVIRKNLNLIASRLPPAAKAFALSNWHYDPTHHQCPHDAWLESLKVEEVASGERHEIRNLRIAMTLLDAYHYGQIQLVYDSVVRYKLEKLVETRSSEIGRGDWLLDEVQLTPTGLVVHEIQFENARLQIECRDFTYSWTSVD